LRYVKGMDAESDHTPIPSSRKMVSYTEAVAQLEVMISESREEGVNLAVFFDRLHLTGFALISLVLSLPFLQPIPLGPFGTMAGVTLTILGWQMFRGQERPLLPKRLIEFRAKGKMLAWALGFSRILLKLCRKLTKPRYQKYVSGVKGQRYCGLLICVGGALMCAPFIAIPFNNMLPACVVFFAALAKLEKDGVMLLVSLFWLVMTLLFFLVITILLLLFGAEAMEWMKYLWPIGE